jgi:hypothetical protein
MTMRPAHAALAKAVENINKQIAEAAIAARDAGVSYGTIASRLRKLRTTPPFLDPKVEQARRQRDEELRQYRKRQPSSVARALAKKYHPDVGGDGEAMGRLTRVRDQIKRRLR